MALARIISRSHRYAEQLALDLLARGYAVEIVSPDAVPDSPADLELRVETTLPNEVTAKVEAHKGANSASLEFLHRIRPAIIDRARKTVQTEPEPETQPMPEVPPTTEAPHSETGPGVSVPVAFDAELPVQGTETVSEDQQSAAEITPSSQSEESLRPVPVPHGHTTYSIAGEPIDWSEEEDEPRDRSETWFWRAAVGFASVALLILVLGLAMGRKGVNPTDKAVAAAPPASTDASLPTQPSTVAVPIAKATIKKPRPVLAAHRSSHSSGEDLIAPDTVVYFRAKPATPNAAVARPAVQGQTAASPSSATIKRYSDMQ